MERATKGGWVYIMSNRYRGTLYVGVTSDLASRIHQHRTGTGSDFCARYQLSRLVWAEQGEDIATCIEQEKRLKRWRREWKFDLIERGNPEWRDMFDLLTCWPERQRDPGSRPG
ncbi:GIY-YIG nuclease family protein [Sphingobium sp. ZW T5_29]|uniref:GIY-YIG nuclease family protein n=1 Tax=Sphingobium sp. ZW T5_29 TaxID=3378077 RepID=UPI0038532480